MPSELIELVDLKKVIQVPVGYDDTSLDSLLTEIDGEIIDWCGSPHPHTTPSQLNPDANEIRRRRIASDRRRVLVDRIKLEFRYRSTLDFQGNILPPFDYEMERRRLLSQLAPPFLRRYQ